MKLNCSGLFTAKKFVSDPGQQDLNPLLAILYALRNLSDAEGSDVARALQPRAELCPYRNSCCKPVSKDRSNSSPRDT